MPYTPFVTVEDLTIFLQSQGIGVNNTALQARRFQERYPALVAGACQEWERLTGYVPFVVKVDDSGDPFLTTRRYSRIENGLLDLKAGIVGQPHAVRQINQNGQTVQTYPWNPRWCYPENAPDEDKPYTYFKFRDATARGGELYGLSSGWGVWGTGDYYALEVEAYFGYCLSDNVPDLAKTAVLSRACLEPVMASSLSEVLAKGGVSKYAEGDEMYQFSPESLIKLFQTGAISYQSTLQLFKRPRIA